MMYSEFIEHSNFTEQYISYAEYTTFIEPIYMAADQIPTKQEFIAMLTDAFMFLECGSQQVQEYLERIDFEARKLAYQYLKLMLTL